MNKLTCFKPHNEFNRSRSITDFIMWMFTVQPQYTSRLYKSKRPHISWFTEERKYNNNYSRFLNQTFTTYLQELRRRMWLDSILKTIFSLFLHQIRLDLCEYPEVTVSVTGTCLFFVFNISIGHHYAYIDLYMKWK